MPALLGSSRLRHVLRPLDLRDDNNGWGAAASLRVDASPRMWTVSFHGQAGNLAPGSRKPKLLEPNWGFLVIITAGRVFFGEHGVELNCFVIVEVADAEGFEGAASILAAFPSGGLAGFPRKNG